MTLWHASTELQLTTAATATGAAKTVYTAGLLEAGMGLGLGASMKSAELDTSG